MADESIIKAYSEEFAKRAGAKGTTHITEAGRTIRQAGESVIIGGALGAVHATIGLDQKGVPLDGVAAVVGIGAAIAFPDHPYVDEARNAGTSALAVLGFRKTAAGLGRSMELGHAGIHGEFGADDLGDFPEAVPDREAYILDRVKAGDYDVNWVAVTSTANGHTARFWVTSDALKINGVRVNVSAELEQRMADVMSASLLTPKLADLMFIQADIRLPPMPMPITKSTAAMIAQSKKIDKAIAKRAGSVEAASGRLIAPVGKDWVIDNRLLEHPGRAINYGWHHLGKMLGVPNERSASGLSDPSSGKEITLIQGVGWVHDAGHTDYSQNARFVGRKVEVDGNVTTLESVLTNPDLAPLASHQGVLRILRQPGVSGLVA